MFAIVAISGSQYRVSVGDTLDVIKLELEVGKEMTFPALLVSDGESVKLGKDATSILVTAKVLKHYRGEKLKITRFKAKSHYDKTTGFRQSMTQIQISAIGDTKAEDTKKTEKAPAAKAPVARTKRK